MSSATPQENTLFAADRTSLFVRHWAVDKPKAVLLVCHGLGEHGGRYAHVADYLAERGFAVFAHDHRGFGKSGGRRGHVERFDRFTDDAYLVVQHAREKYPEAKIYMMGHSLGGLITLTYALRHGDTIDGVISSGAALKLSMEVPKGKAMLGNLVSSIWPSFSQGNGIDTSGLSHDPAVIAAYEADPLVHDRISARLFTEFNAAMRQAMIAAPALSMPLLAYHGGDDPLTDPAGTREFYDLAGSEDKTHHLFEGQLHEVHNDNAKDELFTLLADWLTARATT